MMHLLGALFLLLMSYHGSAFTFKPMHSVARRALPHVANRERVRLQFGFVDDDEEDFVPWKERDGGTNRGPAIRALELDPEALNDLYRPAGADRLKQVLNPKSSHATIFQLDSLVDLQSAYAEAWSAVASQFLWAEPAAEEVARVTGMMPERAIMETFYWTDDWPTARAAAAIYEEKVGIAIEELVGDSGAKNAEPVALADGALEWLGMLKEGDSPLALVSPLSRSTTQATLEKAGLGGIFDTIVDGDDGYERDQQAFLGAAMKLEVAPERAVVFDFSPQGAVAAHEAGMRAVCIIGGFARYELHIADLTISSLADMNQLSLSRLFSDTDFDPEPALQPLPEPEPVRPVRVATKTRVAKRSSRTAPSTDAPAPVPRPSQPTARSRSMRRTDVGDGIAISAFRESLRRRLLDQEEPEAEQPAV